MTLDRRWALVLGAILLANAAFALLSADGHIEGYVSGVICALSGILVVALALRQPSRHVDQDHDRTHRERGGE